MASSASAAAVDHGDLLPAAVLRAIGDRLYDKRKGAALEVEALMRSLAARGDEARIHAALQRIISDFAFSPQPNSRKARRAPRFGRPSRVCVHGRGWGAPPDSFFPICRLLP